MSYRLTHPEKLTAGAVFQAHGRLYTVTYTAFTADGHSVLTSDGTMFVFPDDHFVPVLDQLSQKLLFESGGNV